MRSYGQYCALAKALDVIGDRWKLLIVRELLIRGSCRYTDLRDGLPGIATNLLVERIRELEEAGIIVRQDAVRPVATALLSLSERGAELEAVVRQLGHWGAPLLADAPKTDVFQSHWLTLPAKEWLRDHAPAEPSIELEIRTGEEPVTVTAASGVLSIAPGAAKHADAVLTGPPAVVLALLSGKLTLAQSRRKGVRYKGSAAVLSRLRVADGPAS